jgi:putative oxidoreductase
MKKIIKLARSSYEFLLAGSSALQSLFLLLLRFYFFWQLFLTGKGKLANIGKVSEFFASLGIPLPTLNAYFIGSLECFGSLLLIIGLGSQPLALLIVLSMVVAYLTADFEAVSSMFSDPDKFAKADPFPFLLAALIVLVFGAGRFSVDALIKRRLGRFAAKTQAAEDPNTAPMKSRSVAERAGSSKVSDDADFRGTSSERSWLCGLSRNKICDHFRRLAREIRLPI